MEILSPEVRSPDPQQAEQIWHTVQWDKNGGHCNLKSTSSNVEMLRKRLDDISSKLEALPKLMLERGIVVLYSYRH